MCIRDSFLMYIVLVKTKKRKRNQIIMSLSEMLVSALVVFGKQLLMFDEEHFIAFFEAVVNTKKVMDTHGSCPNSLQFSWISCLRVVYLIVSRDKNSLEELLQFEKMQTLLSFVKQEAQHHFDSYTDPRILKLGQFFDILC
eukprot:TRINITY_DN26306_c0_g1_i1.p1 TRINITY_DN26306_c0_g1~~TRINITY_DN26306_c0_g1_i1.p1  ORF type:complete len:141 (+),score=14.60 TRINITY_DN26306_c0_g1_i1:64-486(+)